MSGQDEIEGRTGASVPSFRLETLKKRVEFKRANGARFTTPFFTLQRRPDGAVPLERMRFGFTVTKKVGNAVARNRIRRRLREAVRLARKPGTAMEIVIFARREVLAADFVLLVTEMTRGLATLQRKGGAARQKPGAAGENAHPPEAALGKRTPLA